ncbi:AAA family ATPase [Actinoplanes sp. TRM 88003]|uniref:AAA family ATPase n=1 Tax=Paractinoplanes aksuensis TaxID=2939490 RepID=A0ABT1E3R5_9ACTN|nr:LuxR family transcriptional regulator [Actinoplanes aksuensis]MCO8277748.1 AAA family ATPase [Actinoplanes aksuensis]
MTGGAAAREVRGRRAECAALDQLVSEVRSGRGQALLLHGEAGIGKSALLRYVGRRSAGFRVARAAGAESEVELPFAGLHQLCGPMLDQRGRLPGPQRDALAVVFGYSAGAPPDRLLVGVAVLSLLAAVAEDRPLLCLIDDAQWLDDMSVQTMTFVARRLLAERVGVVFAIREPAAGLAWRSLPNRAVEGLSSDDARALLESAVPGRLDERVRDRIVAESRGNPLALLELPRGLTAAELAGGFGRPDARPLAGKIERSFAQRVGVLPAATRKLLLTAAAEPLGDAGLLRSAAARLGLPMSAIAQAVEAGLIDLDSRVRFRHPLVRTAVYRAASPHDRREVHRALAEATDPVADPDRRAWHRAHAADEADEPIAADLVGSAERAQLRGGVAAAAEFLRRATELTPDPAIRAFRALAAAEAELRCGAFEVASKLLLTAEGPADELHQARITLLRAQIAFASGHDMAAPRLLLDAARRLEPLDLELARDTYRDALGAALLAGGMAGGADVAEVGRAVLAAPVPVRRRPGDLLLNALAVLWTEGYEAAAPLAHEAVRAFRADGESDQPWLWLALVTSAMVWDEEAWAVLNQRHVRTARALGDLSVLPLTLNSLVCLQMFRGEQSAAAAVIAEIHAIGDATAVALAPYGALTVAAFKGDENVALPLIEATTADVLARGEDSAVMVTHWTWAVLMNGLARYHEALPAARSAIEHPNESGVWYWSHAELIEAAVRADRPEDAAGAYDSLAPRLRAAGTDWALGVLARCTALLRAGPDAESCYRQAVDHLGRTGLRLELARTHLLYGEWLRREGRRRDARGQLRTAHDMLTAAGADAFAERARRELAAAGEVVAGPVARASDSLTVQEANIAALAGSGLTNAEIGAQLFLSQHTVEWHLRKVFTKLGISSRKQLRPLSQNG